MKNNRAEYTLLYSFNKEISMTKPFDVSKFRKSITKSVPGMSAGFRDPKIWISTGNYALNKLISGDFFKGIPLGKVTMLAGESGCLPKSAKVRVRLNFDNGNEQEITVEDLNNLFNDGKDIDIDTPDGYQPITAWYDKGVLNMVTVKTENYSTKCAVNHMIQRIDESWCIAYELMPGDKVITESGIEEVISIQNAEPELCYDFTIDHPNHRYWGDGLSSHNSGKSYLASGNLVKHAQEMGIFVVLIDSENALDEGWLHALGVDTAPEKLLKLNVAMIDDVARIISDFVKDYKTEYDSVAEIDRPKVLFIVDSLGMLLTPTDVDQFSKGDLKGDFGRKPKSLTALVRNCVNMFGNYDMGLVATNHTYASQDMFDPDDKISGGSGFVYASSIVLAIKKLKLKTDSDGNKTSAVHGIRAVCKVMKTRYSKPFERVDIEIPYETGLDPYSGLFDYILSKNVISKTGNKYVYIDKSGNEHKYFAKQYNRNENGILDLILQEWDKTRDRSSQLEDHSEETNATERTE